jgi:hypothetical protein
VNRDPRTVTRENLHGPLYSPITLAFYDPLTDPRVCYLDRGDVQCNFVTRNGDGYLHCVFKKEHTGSHHTAYVDTELRNESELVWVSQNMEHAPRITEI